MADPPEAYPLDPTARYFVLDADHKPVLSTREEADRFSAAGQHIVARTRLSDEVEVTTYFTGLGDYEENDEATEPFLFSTLTEIGPDFAEGEIYRTWAEAVVGHEETVAHYRKLLNLEAADA